MAGTFTNFNSSAGNHQNFLFTIFISFQGINNGEEPAVNRNKTERYIPSELPPIVKHDL